ncbi:MAG: sensor domain-containing diguanylate cyclase [Candidatus Omnitrophica bacterium]|nr:sensor domain-containing diguanylate cyclase [Candidatus Omnitrophota bacterium]
METTPTYNDKLARAQHDLKMLYEISNAMRTTLELESILYIILTSVTSHDGLGFNRAILYLVNNKERCLEPKVALGPDSLEHAQKIWKYIAEQNYQLDDLIAEDARGQRAHSSLFQAVKELKIPLTTEKNNLLAYVYHFGAPVHLRGNELEQYAEDPLLEKLKSQELVVMPLKAKDMVNGVIVADNHFTRRPVNEDDIKMFTMLCNQAGLAIENAQLYERIKHKSYTDSLTEVYNHGFFQDRLSAAIEQAKRNHQTVSLVILDLDDFKMLNDSFGHQTGDCVLKEVAGVLKKSSRDIDFVCRYGGEEFGIILTNTSRKQAFTIAERLRKNIESHQVGLLPNGMTVTASMGVATFPDDAADKAELIGMADKAMYVAKFSGKNRTCLP